MGGRGSGNFTKDKPTAFKKKGAGNPNLIKGMPCPNPGGQPRLPKDLRKYCQDRSWRGCEILAEFMEDESLPAHTRVIAIRELLDRGFGRAPQAVHLSGDDGGPIQVQHNVDAFLEQLRQLRRRIEETELPPMINGSLANGHDAD